MSFSRWTKLSIRFVTISINQENCSYFRKPKPQRDAQTLAKSNSGLHYAPLNRIFKMETVKLFLHISRPSPWMHMNISGTKNAKNVLYTAFESLIIGKQITLFIVEIFEIVQEKQAWKYDNLYQYQNKIWHLRLYFPNGKLFWLCVRATFVLLIKSYDYAESINLGIQLISKINTEVPQKSFYLSIILYGKF